MVSPADREEALARLRQTISEGRIILGAGAGIGLTAKFVEKCGADLIAIYNSGRLPYGDANTFVVDMSKEIMPVVQNVTLLAGVCATDPFRPMPRFLSQLKALGFCGALEETGMSYAREVDMVREARKLELLTTPYVFTVVDAEAMVWAGADAIVVHMGLATSGSIGAQTSCRDAAVRVKPDIIVLCHGGPIATAEDVRYVLQLTEGVHGFFGASSMERLSVEIAVEENAKQFKNIALRLA
ncbi:TIM-barrel-protein domain-containing protein [Trametes gibbosa]|nr:TIM-barrel-protein domain-containing protein [Trametes gibbosa]